MNLAVIFAGGVGKRMNNNSRPKQFLELNGKPIIIYTLELFDAHPQIDGIIVACVEGWIPFLERCIRQFGLTKVVGIVPGGASGQASIYNGLCEAERYAAGHEDDTIVLIHDGVRPLINEQTITDNIAKAHRSGSCITCVPAIETFVVNMPDGTHSIPAREDSLIARAPQTFRLTDILTAHRKAIGEGHNDFIDSCTMMHHYGYDLTMTIGPSENIKITTPSDFFVFRAMIAAKENEIIFGI
ncbi:MAG: 2-C-methyl-D-erythritol 4-phosphate cytidylyltransferase [Duncaniella sp.]|nr:2-C-methyl-D-erythritol 4-phosphate cytidylyltransferase [Duncaniella sp.]